MNDHPTIVRLLRSHAISLPSAWEDFPWGDRVLKVGKKIFLFLSRDPDSNGFGLSLKLPTSGTTALLLPGAKPTGYGLGRAGWVSLHFSPGTEIDLPQLYAWIDESYRAIAPKRLAAQVGKTD